VLSKEDIDQIRRDAHGAELMLHQEPGVRRSSPLPYELVVEGGLNAERKGFVIRFEARNTQFGERAAGSPFIVYARTRKGDVQIRDYAVAAGNQVEDAWALSDFEKGAYHFEVYGPNGFYREFIGTAEDPQADIRLKYRMELASNVAVEVANCNAKQSYLVEIHDNAYLTPDVHRVVAPAAIATFPIDTSIGLRWYDLSVRVDGREPFLRRYAGRVETGKWGFSDPAMGRVVGNVSSVT
jgi:phospholipase C